MNAHFSPLTQSVRWHPLQILLHWLSVVSLLAVFGLVLLRDNVDDKVLHAGMLDWHRNLGALIWTLALCRLLMRLRVDSPDHELSPALELGARLGHLSLYLGILAVPVLGFLMAGAHTGHIMLFGIQWPSPLGHDRDLADTLQEAHEWAAWILAGLIGLHAAAALWHHHVRKDGVLLAMLPARR
jgi:cytochrome b561